MIKLNKVFIALGIGCFLSFSFLGFQTYRIANSLQYGEAQARKFQPVVDVMANQLDEMRQIQGGR